MSSSVERHTHSAHISGIFEGKNSTAFNVDNRTFMYERLSNTLHVGNRKQIETLLQMIESVDYCPTFESDSAQAALTDEMSTMTISATEACNFDCDYCIFSSIYPESRKPSSLKMEWETAQEASDIFIKNARENGLFTFYGGEPTLHWPLMRQVIEYIRRARPDVQFLATTNGWRLKELAPEVVELKLGLTLSLDGPQKIHDKYRHLHGGESSYARIWEGINAVNALDSEYVRNHISTNATCWDAEDFSAIVDFNMECDAMFKNQSLGFVEHMGMTNEEIKRHSSNHRLVDDFLRYGRMYIKDIADGKIPPIILQRLFDKRMQRIFRSGSQVMPETLPLIGACSPGATALFVNTSGQLFVCEKFSNTNQIGRTDRGIDHSQTVGLLNQLRDIRNKICTNCWADRLCPVCVAEVKDVEGKMSEQGLQYRCTENRVFGIIGLVLYIELLQADQNHYHADYLKGISNYL
jgi:uncharacterized protein